MIIAGASLGISLFPMAWEMAKQGNNSWLNNNFTNGLIGCNYFLYFIFRVSKVYCFRCQKIEAALNEMSLTYLLFGSIGAIIGLTIGVIISIQCTTYKFLS